MKYLKKAAYWLLYGINEGALFLAWLMGAIATACHKGMEWADRKEA